MSTVGITGSDGLIGFHLRAYLYGVPGIAIRTANRQTFSDPAQLAEFVGGCDVIVHLAGVNRANDEEIERQNPALADELISAMERAGAPPQVLFSSSTQIDSESVYGRSKRAATERFRAWSKRSGASFGNLVLPNVFGEFGKPFYNSAISTFCHQLARGEEPKIIQDREVEWIHAQQVAVRIHQLIEKREAGEFRIAGKALKVTEVLRSLQGMAELYARQQVPEVRTEFDLLLFNTYRSYLFPTHYPVPLKLHTDNRGSLFEAIKSENGGQTFVSSTRPGITRGNHYHRRKVERFLVIQGEAVIRIRKLFSGEVREFRVNGDEPRFIDIPTFHTHNITNVGSSGLMTLFWAHEIFNPGDPDTYAEAV